MLAEDKHSGLEKLDSKMSSFVSQMVYNQKKNLFLLKIKLLKCIHIFLNLIGKPPQKVVDLYMHQDQMKYGMVIYNIY